jgi:hypothetical protein
MIKVGQTPILLQDPTGAIDRYVESHHSLDMMRFFGKPAAVNTPRGRNLLFPNYPDLPRPKLNQLVIPTGATRWSYGIFLVNTLQKDAILAEAAANSNKLKLIFSSRDNWKVRPEGSESWSPDLSLTVSPLPPRPISPTGLPENIDVQNCWLLPLVDQRYWWQWLNVEAISGEEFADVQAIIDYLNDRMNDTADLWMTCENDEYSSLPDIREGNDYENMAVFIETLAWHIGCQIVPEISETNGRTPSLADTNFAFISVDDSRVIHENNLLGKVGINLGARDPYSGAATSVDSGFEDVGFPNQKMGGWMSTVSQGSAFLPAKILIPKGANSSEYYEKTAAGVGLSDVKTVAGTSAVLRVYYDEVTDDIATQAAKDYYNRFYKVHDYTFSGIQKWQPTAFDDCLVLTQGLFPEGMRVQSRLRSWQHNLLPEQPRAVSGGSGPHHILFVILRVLRGVGLNCNAMECEVLNVSCGGESVASIGDIVTVYDEMGCVFNAPEILLIGRRGYAKQMSNPIYRMHDPLVFEPGTEDIAAPTGKCRWAADRLCCVEEDTSV